MNENETQEVANEVVVFDPPINVSESVIVGGMVVTLAEIMPQDDSSQIVAAIFGDGRVIGVPVAGDAKESLILALS